MSDWDIDYHRRRLEMHSGTQWMRKPKTLRSAQRLRDRAQAAVDTVTALVRTMTVLTYAAAVAVIAAIILAVWPGEHDVESLITALLAIGTVLVIVAPVVRFVVRGWFLDSTLRDLDDAEAALDIAIADALEAP